MRILNVTESYAPFYEFGGPPVKVQALSRGLAARGHEVTVLTADWGVEKRTAEKSELERSPFGWNRVENGVRAIYLPTWLRYRATSWNPATGKFLRTHLRQFDVVHIFGLYDLLGPAVARFCQRLKMPYVVEPIGMFVPIVRNVRLKRFYHSIYGRKLISGAARIIATSEREIQELTKGGVDEKKIVLRRNGVLRPEKLPERCAFRRAKGIPLEARVILFLGRLSAKKSPDLLLRAFAALPTLIAGKELRLVFAGPDEGGMQFQLEELARQLGVKARIVFTGPVYGQEKWAAYQDADVFVLPSQNENFGNTAAEAAAIGTPVIVTEQCGIASLLGDGGIVIPHDETALKREIGLLFENESKRAGLGERGAASASKMSWDAPVAEMEILYRELAQK